MEQRLPSRERAVGAAVGGVLAAVTGAAVVGASVLLWSRGGDAGRDPGEAHSATDAAAAIQAIRGILAGRASALAEGSRSGFSAGSAPSQQAADDRMVAMLGKLPIEDWQYEVRSLGSVSTEQGVPQVRVAAEVHWTWAGFPKVHPRVERSLTFRFERGRWWLGADMPASARHSLWDLSAPVGFALTGPVLAIGIGGSMPAGGGPASEVALAEAARSRSAEIADIAQIARGDGLPPVAPLVVVSVASTAQMATLLGRTPASLTGLGAVSMSDEAPEEEGWGVSGNQAVSASRRAESGRGSAQSIWLNEEALGSATAKARRILIRHELVHMAARAPAVEHVPLWFEEAAAQWFAYLGSGVSTARIAEPARRAWGTTRALAVPMSDGDFTGDEVEQAYSSAWVAGHILGDRVGIEGLMRISDELAATAPPERGTRFWPVLEAVAGLSRGRFLQMWEQGLSSR